MVSTMNKKFTKNRLQLIETFLVDGFEASSWYDDASKAILELSHQTQIDADFLADVIAILSPRVQVSRNCALALNWLFEGVSQGVMQQRIDALELYLQTRKVIGPKVSQFAANLKGDFDAITVDVWIARAFGVKFDKITDSERDGIKDVIRNLADFYGLSPAAAQAAIWVGVRKFYGLSDSEGALVITDHIKEELPIC
jgi:hypothetical protein